MKRILSDSREVLEYLFKMFFIKSTTINIMIFVAAYLFINHSIAEIETIYELVKIPFIILLSYMIISSFVNKFNYSNIATVREASSCKTEVNLNLNQNVREALDEKELNLCAIHEAAHFVACVRMDLNVVDSLHVKINSVTRGLIGNKTCNADYLYNEAFISIIPFIVENDLGLRRYGEFYESDDYKKFETSAKNYLITTSTFYAHPKNKKEVAYNAKLLKKFKEKIEKDCKSFYLEYSRDILRVSKIIKERDIETNEAIMLLRQMRNEKKYDPTKELRLVKLFKKPDAHELLDIYFSQSNFYTKSWFDFKLTKFGELTFEEFLNENNIKKANAYVIKDIEPMDIIGSIRLTNTFTKAFYEIFNGKFKYKFENFLGDRDFSGFNKDYFFNEINKNDENEPMQYYSFNSKDGKIKYVVKNGNHRSLLAKIFQIVDKEYILKGVEVQEIKIDWNNIKNDTKFDYKKLETYF